MLLEDLGEADVYVSNRVTREVRTGIVDKGEKETGNNDRSNDRNNEDKAGAVANNLNGDIEVCSSIQARLSGTFKVPNVRSKSLFLDNPSSILPILCSATSMDNDYPVAVSHRISLKNQFIGGDDNDENYISGMKFMTADDKKTINRCRESFKSNGNDDHLPIHDLDRDRSASTPPDRWEQRRFSAISPTSPANYRHPKNNLSDEKNFRLNSLDGDKNVPHKPRSLSSAALGFDISNVNLLRKEIRSRGSVGGSGGSGSGNNVGNNGNNVEKDNDSDIENDSDDNEKNRLNTVQPAPDNLKSKDLKKSKSTPRKKSLIPLTDKNLHSVNNRMHKRTDSMERKLQRPEDGVGGSVGGGNDGRVDSGRGGRLDSGRNDGRVNSAGIERTEFEMQKPILPKGYRNIQQGEGVMGLQMQRIMSSVQNAQLQKEVDALQKQLAQLEELEGKNTAINVTYFIHLFLI